MNVETFLHHAASSENYCFRLLAASLCLYSSFAVAQSCGTPEAGGIARTLNDAVLFVSPVLNVDADGAPNWYLVNGSGLSYTCDGVVAIEDGKRVTPESDPKNWQSKCNKAWAQAKVSNNYRQVAIFGFQTDAEKRPIVQGADDPLPGKAYVSATSVTIPNATLGTQRQYVDATAIPYIVLPTSFVAKYKVKAGSLAVVYRKKTGKFSFAVFADGGRLGEASVKLHQNLGNNPIVKIAGVERAKVRIEDLILTVVFPAEVAVPRADSAEWNSEIQSIGAKALAIFGGVEKLQACSQ